MILVCNDDGIAAPGLHALAAALDGIGDVFVVAPLTEQSAVGHAITTREPVRARPWPYRIPSGEITAYSVSGTPADCVKLGIDKLLSQPPALVVSGINQGPNTAVNIIYSGTVSAATEATILGIPSIAVSYCRWRGGDFEPSAVVARNIAVSVLKNGLPPGVLLNVNVPDLPLDQLQGISITRQARSKWEESFTERVDPFNQPYYWMSGRFVNMDSGENTDLDAIEQGWVSVTPIHHDLTAHSFIDDLKSWDWSPDTNSEYKSNKTVSK